MHGHRHRRGTCWWLHSRSWKAAAWLAVATSWLNLHSLPYLQRPERW